MPDDPNDRVVHAHIDQGGEIVHYRSDGQWWIEYPAGRMMPGNRMKVKNAAIRATRRGTPILGLPGGRVFDRYVRAELALIEKEKAERGEDD